MEERFDEAKEIKEAEEVKEARGKPGANEGGTFAQKRAESASRFLFGIIALLQLQGCVK
jgi:hypothetical protein